MNDDTVTDASLREFLLGQVADDVRERIESLFLTDPHARERLLAAEQDLIEDYLEGTLSENDRERFVSRYAQTGEQRRKLRITNSIKDWAMTEAATTARASVKPSAWSRLLDRLRLKPSFVIPIAVTALIVIVIAAIWLRGRSQHSGIEQELAQLNAPSNQQSAPVALELSPVAVRGAESRSLNLQGQSEVVELSLLWIHEVRYPRYRSTIRRLGETRSSLAPDLQPESDGKSIHLKLPTQMLTNGTYQISLTGVASDGSTGLADEYTFIVGK